MDHAGKVRLGLVAGSVLSEEYSPTKRACQQQTRLTTDQVDELVREYVAGANQRQLARRFGCHRTTVSALLKSRGITPRNRALTAGQIDRAVELYTSGLSLVAVGELLGANPETIRQRLIESCVPRRDPHTCSHTN